MNAESLNLEHLAARLDADRSALLDDWMAALGRLGALYPPNDPSADLRAQTAELLNLLLASIRSGEPQGPERDAWRALYEHIGSISIDWARRGASPGEMAARIRAFKAASRNRLEELGLLRREDTWSHLFDLHDILDRLVDYMLDTYAAGRDAYIRQQADTIADLTTPVTPIWDGVLLLPLVGTLDSVRAKRVMDTVLHSIQANTATTLLLDITGVPAMDTHIAGHIIKLTRATRMMGCETIITGIAPEVAQSMVHLGIDLGDIRSRGRLKEGLAEALARHPGPDLPG